ncbi:hypothetical protein BHE90_008793 [Fusarium euwallaceae]|uniref:Uncharacterized protein n=1 Tax=Fusarium euwallaceae TaxID=1147111 RepID=A0A430LLV2_9HYPO|nr:hypothetical protein BHE90_008793 [Fusarium euwallaceae]
MSTSFPLFSSFPNEIQELIWDAAVRPVPGRQHVQRFIITDHYLNQANPQYPVSGDFIRFGRQDGPRFGFSLALPWHDPHGNPNESGYAMDSGLWTACTASRAAMIRRFKKNEWWSNIPQEESTKGFAEKGAYAGQEDVFHSATYKTREGGIRHITISTEDLIYLDPRYLDSVDWFHHYAGDPVPLIDYCGDDGTRTTPSFLGLNIAIDFDPRMVDMLANRPVHYCRGDLGMYSMSMVDMVDVLHESAGRTVWFIDHRLRPAAPDTSNANMGVRSKEAEAETPTATSKLDAKRQVFHADGYMLVEVQREDMGLWSIDINDESGNDASTVFDFFEVLFQTGYGRLDIQNSSRMRVLAYQSTSGEAPRRRGPYEITPNPSCLTCYPKEETRWVRQMKPSTGMGSDDDISLSDLNLFDSE